MTRTAVHDMAVLRRGRHSHPCHGGCLLETAAVLIGGRWTDAPAGVDPLLATVARAVNDCTSDARRGALLAFTPWLIGSQDADPDALEIALTDLAGRAVS